MKSVFIIMSLAAQGFSSPVELVEQQSSLEQTTDNYVFGISIDQFITDRNSKTGPAELDWSSDGCTDAPKHPLGWDFQDCCYRHDFGYRNFKEQSRFTDQNKAAIDENFKQDLYNKCPHEFFRFICEGDADTYYEAVHLIGDKKKAADFLEATRAAQLAVEKAELESRGELQDVEI